MLNDSSMAAHMVITKRHCELPNFLWASFIREMKMAYSIGTLRRLAIIAKVAGVVPPKIDKRVEKKRKKKHKPRIKSKPLQNDDENIESVTPTSDDEESQIPPKSVKTRS